MENKKILICGTRNSKLPNRNRTDYGWLVRQILRNLKEREEFEIVEGCCLDSGDAYAEEWAKENNIKVNHFPSTTGNYLKRNIEMVKACDEVIAFWDGFSYGTSQTIATAVRLNKPVTIVDI